LSFAREDESLIHGNEILAGQIGDYEQQKWLRQSDHTFDNIVAAVRGLYNEAPWHTEVLRDLAYYLVLDALICNTDRHHENWGFLSQLYEIEPQKWLIRLRLAPSFDHASSLGRELRDPRRLEILGGNRIDDYIPRGRGGIYWRRTDAHGANPVQLVEVLARRFPEYFRPALASVAKAPIGSLCAVVEEVPESRMSPVAKRFAKTLLARTYEILAGLQS
jgi:hypothetical protein